ncbi:fatty acyl-CoA reductase wat-like [Zophobas morio]|uniref:fatty acyl-CoA reductase wat-like n=1 Tax=Zophobas morio TaxID=2755281 RepID=UPI003082B4EB
MMRFHLKRAQCVSTMSNDSQIVNFFKNQTIFLTGGTGLIGKLLVEKLLRTSFDVKKIYILVRAKHGKNCQQRFDHFFNNSCFEKINQENKSKVSFISGDCSKPDLGLKSEDVDILKTETTCVIHAAANVNFRQTIKEASYNVNSTKEMIKLAKEMNNLKVFVYVSTAYSNCVNNHIREEIYEPPIKAEAFLHLVNSCNEDDLENIFFSYLNKWPNNYVFSKCLSEDLIKNSLLETPIAVVRPSSVTNTMNEPVPGWIDNYHGFIGLTAGSYVGVLRNAYAKKEKKLHLVPADFVCNCILAAAWDTANSKTVKVFNCVGKGISYGELARAVNTLCWKYPTMKCMWNPETSLVQNKFWYNVKAFWMLMLAHCIDFVFFCFKKPARAANLMKRITEQVNVSSYFTSREWNFDEDRFMNLWKKMGDEDKKIFPFHVSTIDWDKYLCSCVLGIRVYLFKDPIATLPKAKTSLK